MIQLILHEYKIFNAQVLFRDDYTSDEFIDVVVGRRVYLPCLYVCERYIDSILCNFFKFSFRFTTKSIKFQLKKLIVWHIYRTVL